MYEMVAMLQRRPDPSRGLTEESSPALPRQSVEAHIVAEKAMCFYFSQATCSSLSWRRRWRCFRRFVGRTRSWRRLARGRFGDGWHRRRRGLHRRRGRRWWSGESWSAQIRPRIPIRSELASEKQRICREKNIKRQQNYRSDVRNRGDATGHAGRYARDHGNQNTEDEEK